MGGEIGPTPTWLRAALRVHGAYFVGYAVFFELLPRPALERLGLQAPQDLLGGIATSVAAGGLLTCGVLFLLAAQQPVVPRFVLATALVQTTYNLFHDAVGSLRYTLSTAPQVGLVVADTALIATLFVVYLVSWRRAGSWSLDTRAPAAGE